MNYPMVNNCLTFYHNEDDTYTIKNHNNDESVTVTSATAEFMEQLDGYTHPYYIDENLPADYVDGLLDKLRDEDLIRESRAHKVGLGTFLFTLFIPKNRTNDMRPARIVCFFLSWLILLSFIPALTFGIIAFINARFNSDNVILGLILGTVAGAVLHEISHAISGCAYGAPVFEMGVMLSHWVIPGAYVLMDQTPVKKRLRRAQINAAGVEMNLLFAGLSLCMASYIYSLSGMLLGCAVANVFLGLLNCTVSFGLDGEHILGNLIGDDGFVYNSIATVFGKEEKKELKKRGINGYMLIVASYIVGLSQLSVLVLIAANVLGVFLWFK